MKLTLLGTGNAAGMPVYGCECQRCTLARVDRSQQRSACSALLEVGEHRYLIDAGQLHLCERFPHGTLQGIFLTHFHPDHVQGLFELRWGVNLTLPVYCPPDPEGCADLYKHPGILDFQARRPYETFELGDLFITPLTLSHSKATYGYLFSKDDQRIVYLTDTKGLPPKTAAYLSDCELDLLVIDCSFPPGDTRGGHNNLDEALDIHKQLRPGRTILTHIGHDMDVWLYANPQALPAGVSAGYDSQLAYPYE